MRIRRDRQITLMVSEVERVKIETISECFFGHYGMQKYLREIVLPRMEDDWRKTGGGRVNYTKEKGGVNDNNNTTCVHVR